MLSASLNKWNKHRTVRVDALIELQIFKPGIWIVERGV